MKREYGFKHRRIFTVCFLNIFLVLFFACSNASPINSTPVTRTLAEQSGEFHAKTPTTITQPYRTEKPTTIPTIENSDSTPVVSSPASEKDAVSIPVGVYLVYYEENAGEHPPLKLVSEDGTKTMTIELSLYNLPFPAYGIKMSTTGEVLNSAPHRNEDEFLSRLTCDEDVWDWSFSSDANKIVAVCPQSQDMFFGFLKNGPIHSISREAFGKRGSLRMPVFSPDDSSIAVIYDSGLGMQPQDEDGIYLVENVDCYFREEASCSVKIRGPIFKSTHQEAIFWSPDRRYIASSQPFGTEGGLFVFDTESGQEKKILEWNSFGGIGTTGLYWSLDSERIAFRIGVEIIVVDVRTGNKTVIFDNQNGDVDLVDWLYVYTPLQVNGKYLITKAGDRLRLRQSPSLKGDILFQLKVGDEITVFEGPYTEHLSTWWKVKTTTSQTQGWVLELPGWFQPVK